MSMLVNMMSVRSAEAGLKERLVRAAQNGPARCSPTLERVVSRLRATPGFAEDLTRAKAMADEKRLLVFFLLRQHPELCACEIQSGLGLTHATVSHHMAILRKSGLVTGQKRGKWMYYSLTEHGEGWRP